MPGPLRVHRVGEVVEGIQSRNAMKPDRDDFALYFGRSTKYKAGRSAQLRHKLANLAAHKIERHLRLGPRNRGEREKDRQ